MRFTDMCQIYNCTCRSRSSNITRFTWYGFNNSGKVYLEVKPDSPDTLRKIFLKRILCLQNFFSNCFQSEEMDISLKPWHIICFSLLNRNKNHHICSHSSFCSNHYPFATDRTYTIFHKQHSFCIAVQMWLRFLYVFCVYLAGQFQDPPQLQMQVYWEQTCSKRTSCYQGTTVRIVGTHG